MRYPLLHSPVFPSTFAGTAVCPPPLFTPICPQICYPLPYCFSQYLSAVLSTLSCFYPSTISEIIFPLPVCQLIELLQTTTDEFRGLSHSGANTQPLPFRMAVKIAPILNICSVRGLIWLYPSLISNSNNRYTAEEWLLQMHFDACNYFVM